MKPVIPAPRASMRAARPAVLWSVAALAPLLLALAACGRQAEAPFTDSRTPPSLGPRYFPPDGWAWGTLEVPGAPPIRYGVASPPQVPRAHVVLLPAYGETAEAYFETANDLIRRGYTVWALDPAGQGGSARFSGARDIGRARDGSTDALALKALISQVIRPRAGDTVVVAASGSAAASALLAAEEGLGGVDGLFLWAPVLSAPAHAEEAGKMTRWGLGGLRATGSAPWARPDRDLSGRATLVAAWQLANPDLRMGGPSWDWVDAEAKKTARAGTPGRARAVRQAVALRAPAGTANLRALCLAAPRCALEIAPEETTPQFAPDARRKPWFDALTGFVEARLGEHAHGR